VQSVVERLPFPDRQFSKVFAVSSFHDWQSQRAGVRQVRRVLRRGGSFVFVCAERQRGRAGSTSPALRRAN
jgi:ubiquinone/menaquinone biosynthesis C-methylase UbiE